MRHVSLFSTVLTAALIMAGVGRADDAIDYNRDIRPILSDRCFSCHGPDKNQRKAKLRLDQREAAIEAEAIMPGEPDDSSLVDRVLTDDPDAVMPPTKTNKPLTAAQKDLLRRWVAAGAPYAAHWSYAPIKRPTPPKVSDTSVVFNPIDAFLQANLEAKRVKPSPIADRATLLRRLSLDLVGLPPTPEEVAAFEADTDPRAYEKQVERLVGSPHFGERMAVPWLDVVRYADTVGFHGDQNQNVWAYRDYVIDAFNTNKPFDQFTIEQLAGDLLPNATPEQKAATCFNRLNMMTREGGAQPKEYLAKYAADRVRTVGMAWLGSTLACAECHDHKFDPFTMRDFYALSAYFADMRQWGVYADYGYTPNPDLKGYNNDYPFPPEMIVESPSLRRRIERLRGEVRAAAERSKPERSAFDAWRGEILAFLKANPSGWVSPRPEVKERPTKGKGGAVEAKTERKNVEAGDDGFLTFTSKSATNEELTIRPGAGRLAAIRLELTPVDGKVLRGGMTEELLRLSAKLMRAGKPDQPVAFRAADASAMAPRYRNSFTLLGVLEGWKLDATIADRPLEAVWLVDGTLTLGEGDALHVTLTDNRAVRLRVSVSPLVPDDLTDPAALRAALEADTTADAPAVRLAYLHSTAADTAAYARIRALENQIRECRGGKTPVMVTEATTPATTRVLPRGNWQDESGPVVVPAPPHFLPQPAAPAAGQRLTRLDLAKWITSAENPLTARVVMNRLWKQFFGTGLSATVDDLGAQGEWPVHPELLDWLASEFRESGWNYKHMVTLMATTRAYRQTSGVRPEVRELDPDNRWLSAQSPRRLEAEIVRDNALAIAGLIDLEVGGPPSFPYQPAGYYENLQFPDRFYIPDVDHRQYRRGVYSHWQRTFLHPMLANFDAPSREDCVAARTQANSPQQALTLLNDPSFVEASRVFAASLLADAKRSTDAERLDRAYRRALARVPRPSERASLLDFLGRMREAYQSRPGDAARLLKVGNAPAPSDRDLNDLAAWAEVCRVILNLHETITRY